MESYPITFKIKNATIKENRRLVACTSMIDLQNKLQGFWGNNSFDLTYLDEDGDCIKVTNDPDFEEAIRFAQYSKLRVLKFHASVSHEVLPTTTKNRSMSSVYKLLPLGYSPRPDQLDRYYKMLHVGIPTNVVEHQIKVEFNRNRSPSHHQDTLRKEHCFAIHQGIKLRKITPKPISSRIEPPLLSSIKNGTQLKPIPKPSQPPPPRQSSRLKLLSSIQNGTQLNQPPTPPPTPPPPPPQQRGNLLSSIQNGTQLKAVPKSPPKSSPKSKWNGPLGFLIEETRKHVSFSDKIDTAIIPAHGAEETSNDQTFVSQNEPPLRITNVVSEPEPEPSLSEPYQEQLDCLGNMGFTDKDRNLSLLKNHKGNMDRVVNALLARPSW
eukprot:CAMPEP_0114400308 /NCGR_PEP_ID=MMETSP0102-20121206/16304_1 /TAXON_ID=38822 ORGANISM="Pteridomonas danica, Strain PT" /NCGR_SAMPLE_ID=MMETSP0102 /ASSEMBLY_ACC=CAM_ASM_000212 /LENGTH=379 /DNA_ID=CAMNT_0001562629 /DNA_START=46 /DNA_END=1182 /DNA_ORIENTATION=-